MSVYVGTNFSKACDLRLSSNWLVSNVLGAQAPPTFVVRANRYCFYMFGLMWLDRSQRLYSTQQQLVSWQTVLINVEASAISPDERKFGFIFTQIPVHKAFGWRKKKRIKELGPDRPYFQFVCAPPKNFSHCSDVLGVFWNNCQKTLGHYI